MQPQVPVLDAPRLPQSCGSRGRPGRGVGWAALSHGVGEVLLTVGVVLLLFVVYALYGTGIHTARAQGDLRTELEERWQEEAAAVPVAPADLSDPADAAAAVLGEAVALLRIDPLWDEPKVVVEGVDTESLKKGPGHQPGTAMPGVPGNFVLAGHRTTYGAPFNRLDELGPGDAVVVQIRDREITYVLRRVEVVDPSDVAVTLPVPRRPGAEPTKAMITLITCEPEYSARQRLVLTGELATDLPLS